MKKNIPAIFAYACLGLMSLMLVLNNPAKAQRQPDKTRILFLLDASASMFARMENHQRWTVAKDVLKNMADSLNGIDKVEMALRVYGHTTHKHKQNCQDTELEVPFQTRNGEKIKEELEEIRPKGTTPIAYSLKRAARDFPQSGNVKNVVILLTDGLEECDGDPCAVSKALQENKVFLKPFIIGIGMSEDFKDQFNCVGRYYNATNKTEFERVLSLVVSQAINTTTTQINLLDIHDKPTETDVNMTFYDAHNDILRYNLYHTFNREGEPDTLSLDPAANYDIQVHTTPPVWKRDVKLTPGKHNVVPIKTPQGKLSLQVSGGSDYGGLQAVVRRKGGDCKIVNHQDFNSTQRYLVDNYQVELLTLPRIKFDNVKIEQDQTRTIQIPEPGRLYINTSENTLGSIYVRKSNEMQWVCNTDSKLRSEVIVLQPGKYKLIYRPENANRSYRTEQKEFEIKSGGSKRISLN